jgi:hypothetical protein
VNGKFLTEWDGKTENNYRVSAGIYFIQVSSRSSTEVIKVVAK